MDRNTAQNVFAGPLAAALAVVVAVALLGLVGLAAAPFVLVAVGVATGNRGLWIGGLALAAALIAYLGLFGVGGGAEGGVVR
jgi:hypothetical protein